MVSVLRVLSALALMVGLLVSLAGFLDHWPGDMITPFRGQLLVLALAGIAVAILLRRRWLVGLAALAVVANACPMALRLIERSVLPDHAKTAVRPISLVFSNVLCDNRDYGRVITMAETEDADIFAAAETTPDWIDHLRVLDKRYPYGLTPRGLGVFGVALYAKRPFSGQVFNVGQHHMHLIRADFGDFVVYVAHPMPPATVALSEDNRAYLQELADRIAVETKPVIIAGDMNATLWSNNLTPLIQARLQWPSGSGLAYSWPSGNRLMAIQIDQILTRGAVAGRYRVLGGVGSDHFPIRADIALPVS